MADPYLEFLIKYNAWATQQIFEIVGATPKLWIAATPGGYGTIGDTLNHLLDSERYYLERLAGVPPTGDIDGFAMDTLKALADLLAVQAGEIAERLPEARARFQRSYGKVTFAAALGQLIVHGVEHRTQICAALVASGLDDPDLSAWRFAGSTR